MNDLLNTMLDASGGLERWQNTKSLYLYGHMGGFMMRIKSIFRPKIFGLLQTNRHLEIFLQEQKLIFHDFPKKGYQSIYDHGDARIVNENGQIVSERKNARRTFFEYYGILRTFYWDELDFIYFLGYMLWTYFTAPYLFTMPGVKSYEIAPIFNKKGQKFRVLEAVFPDSLPAHSQTQQYLIDDRGLNVEMRYHLAIGGLYKFRFHHFITQYEDIDGLQIAIRRRVFFSWDKWSRTQRINQPATLPIWGTVHHGKLIPLDETCPV